jgi:hypothetical protein
MTRKKTKAVAPVAVAPPVLAATTVVENSASVSSMVAALDRLVSVTPVGDPWEQYMEIHTLLVDLKSAQRPKFDAFMASSVEGFDDFYSWLRTEGMDVESFPFKICRMPDR